MTDETTTAELQKEIEFLRSKLQIKDEVNTALENQIENLVDTYNDKMNLAQIKLNNVAEQLDEKYENVESDIVPQAEEPDTDDDEE